MFGARLSNLLKPRPKPIADAGMGDAALRLLMFCDRRAASQEVHLLRPLRRARRVHEAGLVIYSEDVAAAQGAEPRWVEDAFDRSKPHALVFSRFAGFAAEAIIAAARRRGVRIVTHLDDYLLEVPGDVGATKAAHHMRPERIAALTATLRDADLLYISTAPLAAKVRAAGFTAPVIVSELQSCADEDELAPPPSDDGQVRIGYQGTSSHGPDLAMIAPALIAALKARPHATLTLFGTIKPPPELAALGDRVRHMPAAGEYDAFLAALRKEAWHIGLAPLRNTEFNSFRTYTKWTEYALAGAAVLASDTLPYRDVMANGAGLLVRDDGWEHALLTAIDDAPARRRMAEAAQTKLRTELTLARQEQQVRAMLRQAGAP